MRKMIYRHWLLLMAVALGCASCSDDDSDKLSADQQALVGKAVNFSASIADAFATRTTYNATGVFNHDDLMTIYRQYYDEDTKSFDESTEGYRVYSYQPKTVSGTSVFVNTEWKVKAGKTGYEPAKGTFTQTDADSLTWESGQTVRFRAWALSNLSGCLNNGSWDSFYPDFTKSDWVTATGPTVNIPLQLKHLACRISIVPKSGNQIAKVELATDPSDYVYNDNADTSEEDEADKWADAVGKAAAVKAAFDKLCMPGGIDFTTGLKALSKTYRENGSVSNIETQAAQDQMITFGTKTLAELAEQAVRPAFHYNNGNQYLLAIPHDISNESTQGDRLTLPYYTRFRVYLRDVNNGDKNTSDYEGGYHILALNDITDASGSKMFTEDNGGLQLIAGYSYQFQVGYKYGNLTVTMDNSFSWNQQDLETASLNDRQTEQATNETPYKWWKDAIDTSIASVLSGTESGGFNPVFNITNEAEFLEFIKLVNGTAATAHTADYTLERGEESVDETVNGNMNKQWKWYKVVGDTKTEITKAEAEADGFVFYHDYHPADGDNAAYYEELVLDAPYSFYSMLVNRKFQVNLTADLDLNDWSLTAVAASESHPFLGLFDGNFHTLSNVYMPGGYLFGYVGNGTENMGSNGNGAVISHLVIKSEHPVCVVKEGTQVKMLGIRLLAPSNQSAFAETLTGLSYLVGCSNEGDAANALVGKADNLCMYGCMQTASDLTGGALLGEYANAGNAFFAPQKGKVEWGNFMCNFYDIDRSPSAHAVGNVKDAYLRQQYIRGSKTYMLCAWNDQLITDREVLASLKDNTSFAGFYGLAPWKAMNYAVYRYNLSDTGKLYPCKAHYVKNGSEGYNHRYPVLSEGVPSNVEDSWNVLELLN